MYFAQKIYINNKPLVLTTDTKAYIENNPVAEGFMSFEGAFPRHFRLALQHIGRPGSMGAIIEDFSQKTLLEELYELFTPIDAAGGVVTNENNEALMIYRRGKWDLPKGKRDEGETIEDCAVREVSEETGLKKIKLGEKICDTYHVYSQNKENMLKRTAWYKMEGTLKEEPTPQAEENILEARWIKDDELALVVYKSYEAIREVMQRAGQRW